jgi:hypothetical protein
VGAVRQGLAVGLPLSAGQQLPGRLVDRGGAQEAGQVLEVLAVGAQGLRRAAGQEGADQVEGGGQRPRLRDVDRLQRTAGKAARALERNLTCGRLAAEIRAALAIFEQGAKAAEVLELAERITELEKRLAEVPKR